MKKLISLPISTLLALGGINALAETDNTYKVVIEGEVINMGKEAGKVITAIDCNPWANGKARHAVTVDSTGHFSTSGYRIIGKNTELIDNKPPRPNSPAIYDALTEIL